MNSLIDFIKEDIVIFDVIFILIILYNIIKCFSDGFSLSFFSFLKWILSVVSVIVFVPRLQPLVGNYIEYTHKTCEIINSPRRKKINDTKSRYV